MTKRRRRRREKRRGRGGGRYDEDEDERGTMRRTRGGKREDAGWADDNRAEPSRSALFFPFLLITCHVLSTYPRRNPSSGNNKFI
jgi:hypothetical protein